MGFHFEFVLECTESFTERYCSMYIACCAFGGALVSGISLPALDNVEPKKRPWRASFKHERFSLCRVVQAFRRPTQGSGHTVHSTALSGRNISEMSGCQGQGKTRRQRRMVRKTGSRRSRTVEGDSLAESCATSKIRTKKLAEVRFGGTSGPSEAHGRPRLAYYAFHR